ncbi:MAG TPA: hypothetical protein VFX49_11660 [Chloroflexota bacterium]|nr:hypothetical protein [Chloroflexota bacterium]
MNSTANGSQTNGASQADVILTPPGKQILAAATRSPVIQIDRIVEFLCEVLALESSPRCVSISLAHVTSEGSAILRTWTIGGKTNDERSAEAMQIANRAERDAREHAATFDRTQRYAVVAYAKSDSVIGGKYFQIAPPLNAVLGGETEPPTGTGSLAMGMRLTESTARMYLFGQQHMIDTLAEENQRLRNYVVELERGRLEHARLREEMLSKQHERDLALQEAQAAKTRSDRLMGYLETLVPALLEKHGVEVPPELFGKRSAPAATSDPLLGPAKSSGQLLELFRALRDDQRQAILDVLDDRQTEMLRDALKGGA